MKTTPSRIEKSLDKQSASNEAALVHAIKKLENRVIELSSDLPAKGGTSRKLAATRKILKETRAEFTKIYGHAVNNVLSNFKQTDALVLDHFGVATYQAVTLETLTSLITLNKSFHASLSDQTIDKLSAIFIDHAITGGDKNTLIDSIRGALTGGVEGAGRAMESHSRTIAQDGLMTYYQQSNNAVAKQAGVDTFEYYGSLIKDSRPWCSDHVGEVYTRAEIDAFDDDSWAGKKAGSTFVNRGGYNCRHFWVAVV
jgi:hypothetical protein